MNDFTFIDAFCGCGGISLGFDQTGFKCLLAFDKEPSMVHNYNLNRNEKVASVIDIREWDIDLFLSEIDREIDLVIGGAPCQGYSMAGRRDVMDPRNSLVDEFYDVIERIRPKYFVMENVVGILSMKRPEKEDELVSDWIAKRVQEMGYQCIIKKLYAHWYGVGQARPRVFFAGWREDCIPPPFPPAKTHHKYRIKNLFGKIIEKFVTVNEVFSSIPIDAPNQDLVYEFKREDYIERVKKLGPGESVYDNFKESHRRLDPDKPAFTIKENHGSIAIHPSETRMINIREAAALQDFPHDYKFEGDNRDIIVQIGNAVPVGLARAIASTIRKALLMNIKKHQDS